MGQEFRCFSHFFMQSSWNMCLHAKRDATEFECSSKQIEQVESSDVGLKERIIKALIRRVSSSSVTASPRSSRIRCASSAVTILPSRVT